MLRSEMKLMAEWHHDPCFIVRFSYLLPWSQSSDNSHKILGRQLYILYYVQVSSNGSISVSVVYDTIIECDDHQISIPLVQRSSVWSLRCVFGSWPTWPRNWGHLPKRRFRSLLDPTSGLEPLRRVRHFLVDHNWLNIGIWQYTKLQPSAWLNIPRTSSSDFAAEDLRFFSSAANSDEGIR